MQKILEMLLDQQKKGKDTVLCTIIASSGSTPRGTGAQMLVGGDGLLCGTIGGGSAELLSLQRSKDLLDERKNCREHFAMHPNGAGDIGMVCGGDVEVDFCFIAADDMQWHEVAADTLRRIQERQGGYLLWAEGICALLDQERQLIAGIEGHEMTCLPLPIGERCVVFGGGHVAMALVPLLKTVGFRITVIDDRPQFARKERFPDAEAVLLGDYQAIDKSISITEEDYVVVMTNGHNGDYEVQRQVLPKNPAYVGVIGSKKKTAFVREKLSNDGIPPEQIDRVHAPIGTAILAVTPAEIAVSIAGEMILERALQRGNEKQSHACPMHQEGS